jgi:hypothetical protein
VKIGGVTVEKKGTLCVVSAEIEWEANPGQDERLYVAVPSEFADLISPTPHAFLLTALVSAGIHEETRVQLDEPVSPFLAEGAGAALGILSDWYGDPSVAIEAPSRAGSPEPPRARGAGLFFSGGVDSLASLQRNRELSPRDSAEAITHCINVDWLGPRSVDTLEGELRTSHEPVLKYLRRAAEAADTTFVPVVTNLRCLENYDFNRDWMRRAPAPLLCAVAHALSGGIQRILIASTNDVPHLRPWGSHPLLDSKFSSEELTVAHDEVHRSRLRKVETIAVWDSALDSIIVCTDWMTPREGPPNCGRCEKCLRTLASLKALGVERDLPTFPEGSLTPQAVRKRARWISTDYKFDQWGEIEPMLRSRGEINLAQAVRSNLRWSLPLKFDRRHFDERGARSARWMKRVIRRHLSAPARAGDPPTLAPVAEP